MRLKEKPYWLQLIVLALFMLGGMLVFSSLGTLLVTLIYHTPNMMESADPVTAIRITQTLTTIGTFLVPALLFAYCQDRRWFGYNAADRIPKQSMVNMVLVLSVTLLPVVGVLSAFNQNIMPQEGAVAEFMRDLEEAANHILEVVTSQRSSWDLISNILVFAVLAGICEEFFFQGALQPLLMNWTRNPHVGILLTALIFSALHFQFYGFIPRFLLGLYLGYLFYWSRSLWLPILAHVLHNALSILVDFTLQGRGIDTDSMQFTDMRGSLPTAAACALISAMAIVYLWRIYRDDTANGQTNIQRPTNE
ncbi:MAG: CPBP family intramembrane metalloprotease [Bacteroidales bacterium]|nr:CPBP family intramembrane metalloprotease [Bacteroidales bacterium]MBR6905051.1 CPBP family intramembrane metalloprotease [Bacteroidales bacterium]